MLRRKLFSNLYRQPQLYKPHSFQFCVPKPSETPKEESSEKEEKFSITITPRRVLIGLVCVSWVFLLKMWYDIQEPARQRAYQYYEEGGSMDPSPPEEYRKEYVRFWF